MSVAKGPEKGPHVSLGAHEHGCLSLSLGGSDPIESQLSIDESVDPHGSPWAVVCDPMLAWQSRGQESPQLHPENPYSGGFFCI